MTQMSKGPGVRRRLLARALIELREKAGITPDDVAAALEFSKSKLSRIETSSCGVSMVDTRALGALYGVDEPTMRWLERLTRVAKQRGRWHTYGEGLVDWFSDFVVLESEATAMEVFGIDLVPGLLQTTDYARSVIRAGAPDASDEVVEQRVELRQARQRRVEDGSLDLWVILDEAALRRAGEAQLRHLMKMAKLPNVTLQVVPFGIGSHIAAGTPFCTLKFEDYPAVVYLDNLTDSVYLDDERDVRSYSLVFDHLRATALDLSSSVALVKRVIGGS